MSTTRTMTPTLAIILAGGLAAGIALARPGSGGAPDGGAETAAVEAAATDQADGTDETYRRGTRTAGDRGGAEAPATPAAPGGGQAAADDGAGAPTAATITIEGFAFDGPATVAPGAALTVTNNDGAPHTLTFRSGGVDTGNLAGGATTTVTAPTAPGTYDFFCEIHPSMEGSITVAP
ncbi:MAG: cupredoxin domain-containing protein [Actinomycetota bacterium]